VASYGDGDEISGRCLILTDITELKRMDQLKTDLIGFVSHELKTPLTNIGLYTELLKKRLEQPDEKIQHITNVISRQGVRMRHLVEDFLNISRLEADRELPMNMERLDDIVALVEDIVTVHTYTEQGDDIVIALPDDPPALWADRTKVEEVFANLVSNARKFSPKGGTITVRGERDGEMMCFCVSDQGIGIPEEKLDNLFRRFERLDASASRIPGTGLGLFVCKHLVEAHGGDIWVESTEGEGSTFCFTVPIYAGQAEPVEDPEGSDED
jgi:signal transduction histidine kinase